VENSWWPSSTQKGGDRLFNRVCCDRARGNAFKLKEGRFRSAISKKLFTMRVDLD